MTDYRDLAIADLVDSEAALIEAVRTYVPYAELAQLAIGYLANVTQELERERRETARLRAMILRADRHAA
jgi:hypothetical protein